MPHASVGRFRKCGEKPRSTDQTPVLAFRDLRFCCRNSVYARRFPIFPRTSEIRDKNPLPEANTNKCPSVNSPLNAKTAFRRFPRTKPNVSSQGLITRITLRENLQGRQSNTAKLSNQILNPSWISHSSRQSCQSGGHRQDPHRLAPLSKGDLTRSSIE